MPVSGVERLVGRLRRASNVGQAMDKWANDGAATIAQEAVRLLDDGAILGAGHKPSIAPASPNSDTRNLAEHTAAVDLPDIGHAAAISDAEYSAAQEFGYAPNNLPERPYMRVAASNKRKALLDAARKAVDGVAKG